MCRSSESPIERIKSGLADLPAWLAGIDDAGLGEPLVDGRGLINRLEAVLAEPMRRFEKSGAYRADGALDLVAWLRWLGERTRLGPTAVVVDSDLAFGIVRMVEMLVDDVCQVKPFRTKLDAELWLDQFSTR